MARDERRSVFFFFLVFFAAVVTGIIFGILDHQLSRQPAPIEGVYVRSA